MILLVSRVVENAFDLSQDLTRHDSDTKLDSNICLYTFSLTQSAFAAFAVPHSVLPLAASTTLKKNTMTINNESDIH